MTKSRDAFRTISEVAEALDTQPHVLRFWESKFPQIKPVKRAGGRRYYRPADMALLAGLKKLLHEDGLTIKGAQKVIREQGVKHVASLADLTQPSTASSGEQTAKVPQSAARQETAHPSAQDIEGVSGRTDLASLRHKLRAASLDQADVTAVWARLSSLQTRLAAAQNTW